MRRRLVTVAAATTTMVAIAFVVPLALLVRSFAAEQALAAAQAQAAALAPAVATLPDSERLAETVAVAARRSPGPLTVVLPDGTTVGAPLEDGADADVVAARRGRALTTDAPSGRAVLVPVVGAGGEVAVVRAVVPGDALREGVARAWALLAALGVALVGGAVLVADRLGRSTVGSVLALERVADRIGRGDLDARADVADPPEVAAVADALHLLAQRVRELLAGEREHVADLAHRVRTPMTALRLDVEALPPSAAATRLEDDLDRLQTAVDEAIVRARQPRDGPAASGRADLGAVVAARCAFWEVIADDQGRSLEVVLPERPQPVALPADEAAAAVDAVLGNVFAHTPEGTDVSVRVEAGEGAVRLVIDDAGPGFAVAGVAATDTRLVGRGVSGAGSTGLGLDIARRAAERSGGGLEIGRSRAGGARVVLRFGAHRPAHDDPVGLGQA